MEQRRELQMPSRLAWLVDSACSPQSLSCCGYPDRTILTYVGIALFIALGMDPIVRALTKWKLPRPLAVIIVIAGFLGAVALLLWRLSQQQ